MMTLPWFCAFRFKTQAVLPYCLTDTLREVVSLKTYSFIAVDCCCYCLNFFFSSCYFHTWLLLLPSMVITIVFLTPGKRFTMKKRGNLGKLHPCCEHCREWWRGKDYNNVQCPSPHCYRGCIHSLQCSGRKGNHVNWKICFAKHWANIASYLGSLKTCSFYSTHTQIAWKERDTKISLV